MAKIKLLTDGGFKGLEEAVGKTLTATKVLGHWNVCRAELERVGCSCCMDEYAFLTREVEVTWHTQGL